MLPLGMQRQVSRVVDYYLSLVTQTEVAVTEKIQKAREEGLWKWIVKVEN